MLSKIYFFINICLIYFCYVESLAPIQPMDDVLQDSSLPLYLSIIQWCSSLLVPNNPLPIPSRNPITRNPLPRNSFPWNPLPRIRRHYNQQTLFWLSSASSCTESTTSQTKTQYQDGRIDKTSIKSQVHDSRIFITIFACFPIIVIIHDYANDAPDEGEYIVSDVEENNQRYDAFIFSSTSRTNTHKESDYEACHHIAGDPALHGHVDNWVGRDVAVAAAVYHNGQHYHGHYDLEQVGQTYQCYYQHCATIYTHPQYLILNT